MGSGLRVTKVVPKSQVIQKTLCDQINHKFSMELLRFGIEDIFWHCSKSCIDTDASIETKKVTEKVKHRH